MSPVQLLLVHHGDAVPPDVDSQRPLSERGRREVERLAADAAARGARPDVIWHSGKLRARQTAEAFWRACNPLAEFSAVRGLQPTDPPEWLRDRILVETRPLMLVGHMPNLPRLMRLLRGEDPDGSMLAFPLNGVVMLEGEDGSWSERWRLEGSRLP
jgi:phosphohistidine phosphatase